MTLPTIIQGGMGAGVSGWTLASSVSKQGQLGVVAGTALDVILTRRLQLGDEDGSMRRGLNAFPLQDVARRILEQYFIPGGKQSDQAFRTPSLMGKELTEERSDLIVAANFVEVFLAREGHDKPVGINYLEKIQFPTLPSIFGAMLAGVGYVFMGAGIPIEIPRILDVLASGLPAELDLSVQDGDRPFRLYFDPRPYLKGWLSKLERPKFIAIVSSNTVAGVLLKRATSRIDGFVIEGPRAGGHNAKPRGQMRLDEAGEPIYSGRDTPDMQVMSAMQRPFWLAGSRATPQDLAEALDLGAAGIQVGTAFAFCEESGLDPGLRRRALLGILSGQTSVKTDPLASPTGFPFKVLELEGTLADDELSRSRRRVCDLGFLRQACQDQAGELIWRCSGEPAGAFERKGGTIAGTIGRKCVCNGLLANIGMAQRRKSGALELPLLTSGQDLRAVVHLVGERPGGYRAIDVLDYLLPVQ